jgi:hypothetical protein
MTARRANVLIAIAGVAAYIGACFAVRGGLLGSGSYGDVHLYDTYSGRMADGKWPYGDFFDEYPPLAQPLFLAVRLLPGDYVLGFRWTMAILGAAALVVLVVALATVGASRLRIAVAAAAVAVSPLLVGPIYLNAYDLWPAFLTACALLAFLRGRERTMYVLLALGVTAKIYPIVLLPLALVETWEHGGRDAVRRALAWFAGVVVLVHLPFAIVGHGGLGFSYWVQVKRGLEVESLGGAVLLVLDRLGVVDVTLKDQAPGSRDVVGVLANVAGALTSLALAAAVLLVAWLYLRGRRDRLLAAAAAVTAFVAFSKVFSPQYVTWLVAVVPGAGIAAAGLLVVILALTHVVWDHFVTGRPVEEWAHALAWWVFVRDVVVVALYALLVRRLWRLTPGGATPRTRR